MIPSRDPRPRWLIHGFILCRDYTIGGTNDDTSTNPAMPHPPALSFGSVGSNLPFSLQPTLLPYLLLPPSLLHMFTIPPCLTIIRKHTSTTPTTKKPINAVPYQPI